MDRRRQPLQAASMILAGVILAGCAAAADAAPSRPQAEAEAEPARVVHMPGTDRSTVVLTADAAKRVGLTTEPITAAATAAGASGKSVVPAGKLVTPLAAVLYDKDGKSWVYTVPRPLTFVPIEVVIADIDGDSATLSSGPAAGTPVVTVGGAELLGAEYGVPGEQ